VLLRFGCKAGTFDLIDDGSLLGLARSAEAVDALLTVWALEAAESQRLASPKQSIDAVVVRRGVIDRIFAANNNQPLLQLVRRHRFRAALALANASVSAQLSIRGSSSVSAYRMLLITLASNPPGTDPVDTLQLARVAIASLQPEALRLVMQTGSGELLQSALASGQLALAQLFVDSGADVFAGHNLFLTIPCADTSTRRRLPLELLPPCANPWVEASDDAAFAGYGREKALAFATAAAVEEERLLAAVLEDPRTFQLMQKRSTTSLPLKGWLDSIQPILSLRWLWLRMHERDSVRALALLSTDSVMSGAVKAHDARRIRFLVAHACETRPFDCSSGRYETAWALGLIDDVNVDFAQLCDAIVGGHRFSDGIAGEIMHTVLSDSFRLTDIFSGSVGAEIPGEFGRMLHWLLNLAKRSL